MDELGRVIERHRARLQAAEEARAAATGQPATRVTNRELSRRSGIHWGTFATLIDGQVGRPEMLGDLARVFADDEHPADDILAELQGAAGLPVGEGLEWKLPADYLMFPRRTRAAFENLMRAVADDLIEAHGRRRTKGRVHNRNRDDQAEDADDDRQADEG